MSEPKRLDQTSRLDFIMAGVGVLGIGLLALGRYLWPKG